MIRYGVLVIFGENPKPGFEPCNLDFLGHNINPRFFMVASADGMMYIIMDAYVYTYILGNGSWWWDMVGHNF